MVTMLIMAGMVGMVGSLLVLTSGDGQQCCDSRHGSCTPVRTVWNEAVAVWLCKASVTKGEIKNIF